MEYLATEILKNSENTDEGKKIERIKLRSAIFYFLRVILKNHKNKDTHIAPKIIASKKRNEENLYHIDEIRKYYPLTMSKRIDMVMALLATEIETFNTYMPAYHKADAYNYCYFYMPANSGENEISQEAKAMTNMLKKKGYIDFQSPSNQEEITFALKGWKKIEKFSRKSWNVFVAMAFSPNKDAGTKEEKEKQQYIIDRAEHCIKQAFQGTEYIPVIVKDKQHTNYIMTEIINDIESAAFVVADLTFQKPGVYFEAGYAKALGKEVIMTCHTSDFDNRHFDVTQHNTIKWDIGEEKETEFITRLKNMIFAIDKRINS
ncbi:MAG: nucleoside 2-deoxyribosyltransferase [Acidaminococcales bacterium]|nr:nucleoside 2-deoxyribosyltransferase [Acidaminococcales bacterium]